MDSITQIALGAAVGEAALGRRVGNLAPAWGAVLGTLPDLDILLYPLLDPVNELAMHRSFSHSILFSVTAAPVFGWLLAHLHRGRGVPLVPWAWLAFLALFTHLALDSFTVYGTQVFWPFSAYPVSLDSIFVIDPAYTLPLALGVLLSLGRRRDGGRRLMPNRIGLALSTVYLAWTLVAKAVIEKEFRADLDNRGIIPERVMTNPAPFNTILWMGIAEAGDTLYVGLQGLFDAEKNDGLIAIPRNPALLAGHEEDRAVRRLAWFSKGWWALERRTDGSVAWNDVRFGRNDVFLAPDGEFVFRFVLPPSPGGTYETFDQEYPDVRFSGALVGALARRASGHTGDPTTGVPRISRP